jgi:hypothetical protein
MAGWDKSESLTLSRFVIFFSRGGSELSLGEARPRTATGTSRERNAFTSVDEKKLPCIDSFLVAVDHLPNIQARVLNDLRHGQNGKDRAPHRHVRCWHGWDMSVCTFAPLSLRRLHGTTRDFSP